MAQGVGTGLDVAFRHGSVAKVMRRVKPAEHADDVLAAL